MWFIATDSLLLIKGLSYEVEFFMEKFVDFFLVPRVRKLVEVSQN